MEDLNELLECINFSKFIQNYTTIKLDGGVKTRKTGKGTNANDKKTSFKPEEVQGIVEGLKKFVEKANKVIKKHHSK